MLNVDIVQQQALWQLVVPAIRQAIVVGELEPGVRLTETALAERFGVSAAPIREALVQLKHEGLVRILPRRGAYVIGVTEQRIKDMYECRLLLESYAIRRGAERTDEQGLATLSALVDQMEASTVTQHAQLMAVSDMAFHRQIIDLAGNLALVSSWEPLAPLIETVLGIADSRIQDWPAAAGGHREIVHALQHHDPDAAIRSLSEQMRSGEKVVHAEIRRRRERSTV